MPADKDNTNTPTNKAFQPAIEKCESGQEEVEIVFEEQYDDLEIVEQLALDHFNSILQKAQKSPRSIQRDMIANPRKH
jgi:hypothetical protein